MEKTCACAAGVGVVFSQEGGLGSRQLPPGEARGYYWERPQSSPHLLCLEVTDKS